MEDMILYLENTKDSTVKLPETIHVYSKVTSHKNQYAKDHEY